MARSAAETREHLARTALRLFRDEGYDATTMRRIASEAGVSLGNAYHHFEGKDALVQELYAQIQHEHRASALPQLVDGAPLGDQLRTAMHAGVDVMAPYHGFGQTLLRIAIQPTSDLSPFSAASASPRAESIALMHEVVDRSGARVPKALGEHLPLLLWLAYLGVTLHWVTDTSTDQQRTRALIDGLGPLVGRAVSLSRVPGARGLVDQVVGLLDSVAPDRTAQTGSGS